MSSSMASAIGPGDLNTSPASSTGVMTESVPEDLYVASSRWVIEEPSS